MLSNTLLFRGLLIFLALFSTPILAAATEDETPFIRSIFLFKDVLKSNTTALQTSGFNTLIIFGVGVLANGDIMYYSNTPGSTDTLIASNGSYVGGDTLAAKVRSFKEGAVTTQADHDGEVASTGDVDRVEISMNAQNIQELMMTMTATADSRLYQNFVALKEAWALDAVNNDDESIYDTATTVTFAKMLGTAGYRYTIAPYTRTSFWADVVAEVNADDNGGEDKVLDRVYLQLYDGGAGNRPGDWQTALGMKVVPILWVVNDSKPQFGQTPAQAEERFALWKEQDGIAGGGYWNDFDIEKMGSSYTEYGVALSV